VIHIAAPNFEGRPSIVKEVKVQEGDAVEAGQLLAVLDGQTVLQATLHQSEARVAVARSHVAQIEAGTKIADLAAQKMEVARWQSEYETAQAEYQRYETLRRTGDVSASEIDEKRLAVDRAKKTWQEAEERTKSLAEVRREDVAVAQAEVSAAEADARRVRAQLDSTLVRSPIRGRVLKIHARPGEEVQQQGLLELGKTDRMYVMAEVYETDVRKIHVGEQVSITGEILPGPLRGTVAQIGTKISRSEMLPTNPATFADTRVVEVKVRLEGSEGAAGLIHGRVNVVIGP
jgi:HlyD family secretion protein